MSEEPRSKSTDDLDARLKRLKAEVDPSRRKSPVGEPVTGIGMAFTVSAHLVAGVAGGAAIGYLLDKWLQTSPAMLIVFFFLGSAAGMLNVYRTVSGMGMALGYRSVPTNSRAKQTKRQGAEAPAGDTEQKEGGNNRG